MTELQLQVITQENWEERLWQTVETDLDWTGQNGVGYASEEAINKGFESDYHFALSEGKSKFGSNWKKVVDYVLGEFVENPTNEDYYDVLGYDSMVVGESLVFCFIAQSVEN